MTKNTITDDKLDALLSERRVPIIDNDFTVKMLDQLDRQEKLHRYIPLAFGIVGAIITSFYLPIEFLKEIPAIFSSKESLVASFSSPMAVAFLLSTPLGLLLVRQD